MSPDKDIISEQYTHEIVRDCIVEYGRYALEERAIPDVRDGLKPSQRRILWTMHEMGLAPNKASVKCARVVGDTMGRFHPHGDQAIYDTLVNLTHAHHPLIRGDGNFGDRESIVEKPAAAYRYTECRPTDLAASCFQDIHVADTQDNYDNTTKEPVCLPVQVPLLLVNGSDGIAVGLATHIPPHNLAEVVDATIHLLANPEATTEDLLQFIKGPDYGRGILLAKKNDLLPLYETGEGKLTFCSQYHIEDTKRKDIQKLVITGLAPSIKKPKLHTLATELHRGKLLDSPVNNETTLKGYRETITYRDPQILRNRILPLLESSITYRWYGLDSKGKLRRFNLVDALQEFIDFRRLVEERVLRARKKDVTRKLGIAVAKHRTSQRLDEVAALIRKAKSEAEAVKGLLKLLNLKYDWQAEAVLDTPLRQLMRLRKDKLKEAIDGHRAELKALKAALLDVDGVIRRHLEEAKKFSTPRGTRLRSRVKDIGEDVAYWVGVTEEGKIDTSLELPLASKAEWKYVDFVQTRGEFAIVHDTNQVSLVHVSYPDRYEPLGRVVGVVAAENCAVITKRGRYVAFKTEQRRKQFPAIRDLEDDEIVGAAGFDDETEVGVIQENGDLMLYGGHVYLNVKRPNVKAAKLLLEDYDSPIKCVFTRGKDTIFVSSVGEDLGEPDYLEDGFFLVGESNFLSLQTKQRVLKSQDETLQLIADGKVIHCVPNQKSDS